MTKPSNPALIPWPASVTLSASERFAITKETAIETSPGQADLQRIAKDFADLLRPALDGTLTIRDASNQVAANTIRLEISPSAQQNSDEGYDLTIASTGVRIVGASPAGVFYGVQTLRQLLPWSVELRGARPHAIAVATGHIVDRPRFVWRGAMLDVARHFYGPRDVKRYIDLLASYKFNRLHLHLSDDQGWRIEIAAWPNLTAHGGTTAVGGGSGGFYTKQDYADLVAYARDRFITIVPEIDMPSHINAALSSYPELNCNGVAPKLYTGIDVGFSNFCLEKEITYKFIDDVVAEISAITPAPYFHIGGDEVKTLTPDQYKRFIERVQGIVVKHGKQTIGWDEIAHATLQPSTIIQVLAPRRLDHASALDEAHSLARQQNLSGHEVPRRHRPGAQLGRQRRCACRLRVESRDAPAGRARDRHPWSRGADLVGDAGNDGRSGVHGVPASGWRRRGCMVAAGRKAVDRIPHASRRSGAAMDGARDQRLLVADCRLDALKDTGRCDFVARVPAEHLESSLPQAAGELPFQAQRICIRQRIQVLDPCAE